jgi:hypothetical protein
MGRIFLILAAVVSILVGLVALGSIRSDIQIIVAMVGIIGGIIMGAQASILGKLAKLAPRQ